MDKESKGKNGEGRGSVVLHIGTHSGDKQTAGERKKDVHIKGYVE